MTDNLKEHIDLINSFSSNFFSKANKGQQVSVYMQQLDSLIEAEKSNEAYLNSLEKKISDTELTNIADSLLASQKKLFDKYTTYLNLIESNSKKIKTISSNIQKNKSIIDNTFSLTNNIDLLVRTIDSNLNDK